MIVLVPNGLHPHLPEDDRVERNDFVQRIKQRIQQDPSLPIKRAYDTEFLALPANGRMHAATFEEVRSALQRFRMAFVPALPPDIYGVNIQGTWAETWDGRRKMLASDNVLGVTIFASDEELVTLSQCDEIYIDGTFRTAPFPFTQIVVIHGKYHGWILPLVFALSTGIIILRVTSQVPCFLVSFPTGFILSNIPFIKVSLKIFPVTKKTAIWNHLLFLRSI